MKYKKYFFIAVTILFAVITGFDQSDDGFLERLKIKWKQFILSHPEEKVYLQFDKTFYKPGEDIWFNAFLLNANTHKPSDISDVVYVELKDPKGNVVTTLNLFVQEGTSKGDFHLDESIPGGLYTVLAYTRWMQNAGEETYFKKEIQVQKVITPRMLLKLDFEKEAYGKGDEVTATLTANDLSNEPVSSGSVEAIVKINGQAVHTLNLTTDREGKARVKFNLPPDLATVDGLLQIRITSKGQQESISRSIPIVLNNITLQFFPEGGDLVTGVESTVAFKATNEFGKGADVSGVIVDDRNTVVTSFESYHMGMGSFRFTPEPNKRYSARINTPLESKTPVFLPTALSTGYTLALGAPQDNSVRCVVTAPADGEVFLVGQAHGEIQYSKKHILNKGVNQLSVPVQDFPAGIAVFTLFNSTGIEEAERLIFLNNEKSLHITVRTDKKDYRPREKVSLKITTTDAAGKPIPARVSLAVADDQILSFADDKQDNIISRMLLSSEIKGEIQEPSFYFDKQEPKAGKALDLLLMTHGWRRFTWKDVFKNDRAIVYLPENSSSVSGTTFNQKGEQEQTEVVLMELGGRKRIAHVKTKKDGQFVFKNIDASVPLLLLTRLPNRLEISGRKNISKYKEGLSVTDKGYEGIASAEIVAPAPILSPPLEAMPTEEGEMDLTLEEDATSLSEVIVVGWGTEDKGNLTGSIVTMRQESIGYLATYASMENVLQGRVAGVQIQQTNANPGTVSTFRIRGISSLANGRGEPLYVVDGQPIGTSLNENFSNGSILGPEDIASIEVMHTPEATAIFGSAAANGVIVITTKSRIDYNSFREKKRKARYASLVISPRKFSATRDFFAAPVLKNSPEERKDFRTTVYWNPTVVTDEKGEATVSFANTDATSAFRIIAEGISGTGLIGRQEEVYSTQLPFSLDAKIPPFLGFEDTLYLPVMVKNTTSSPLRGKLILTLPKELQALDAPEATVVVDPSQTKTHWFGIASKGIEGKFQVSVKLEGNKYEDAIHQVIEVHPIGFPMRQSLSGKSLEESITFTIDDLEKGSLNGEATAFTDVLSDLFTGAESILQAPHGCFEQVSSSTFPNILALQFLKESGQIRPQSEKLATTYIQNGYKQLMAYEIKGGGFEWFGHPPAHEGLTAYGLIEFHEMKKVFDGVDEAMMSRTRDWLLGLRKGDGTFRQHEGKYGFSGAAPAVTNAYLVYALAETGTTEIESEYQHSLEEAWKSGDMYRMALMANASYSLGKMKEYEALIDYFSQQSIQPGLHGLKVDHSIVRSYGQSLTTETVSLWAVALMRSPGSPHELLNTCVQFILSKRSCGMFGSTQATTLALKALTAYAHHTRSVRDHGEFSVTANSLITDVQSYTPDTREKITLTKFNSILKEGSNTLQVKFLNTSHALPYSVNIRWNTKTPVSDDQCKVKIKTSLAQKTVNVNETVRLTVMLQNTAHEGIPMNLALIGIPAGLSPQPWQLKEMQEKGVFDFYELMGNRLAIYYRALEPDAQRTINLDLKAEVPGNFTGSASTAYLYYTDEHKHWVKGNEIEILP